jgi:hypothetical protein
MRKSSSRNGNSPSKEVGRNKVSDGKSSPGSRIKAISESKAAPPPTAGNSCTPPKVDYLAPRIIQYNDEVLARAQSMKLIQLQADAILSILEKDDSSMDEADDE